MGTSLLMCDAWLRGLRSKKRPNKQNPASVPYVSLRSDQGKLVRIPAFCISRKSFLSTPLCSVIPYHTVVFSKLVYCHILYCLMHGSILLQYVISYHML